MTSQIKSIINTKKAERYHRVVHTDDDNEKNTFHKLSLRLFIRQSIDKLHEDIDSCKRAIQQFPKDIYFIFYLKFLESYSYFALSQILVIYLHDEFHVSDIEAGMVYGMWGAAITLWGLLISWVNDNMGVRNSLVAGFTISTVASTLVATASSKTLVYVVLFALYPIGTSLGIPMLTIAIKRYTSTKFRGFAFGLYYSVMNMAALVSGPIVDALNIGLKEGVQFGGVRWTGYRLVILTCTVSNLISLVIAAMYLREVKFEEEEESVDRRGDKSEQPGIGSPDEVENPVNPGASLAANEVVDFSEDNPTPAAPSSSVSEYKPVQQNPWVTARELLTSPTFWRFAALTLLLVNLHAIFRHLDATQPTYLVRCFGDNVPKGTLYSINPFMIIFLTPLVAALTNTYNHFNMIKWGGYLTAGSPFFLAGSTSIWAVVCMNVTLSLGEAIWSPRLYDYVMTVAPEGREASFSALASAPLFAAKIPVGLMSGYLLSTYLPENGKQRPKMMWLIIGLMTMTSPILITLFDPWIREPEKTASSRSAIAQLGNESVSDERRELELGRTISKIDVTISDFGGDEDSTFSSTNAIDNY